MTESVTPAPGARAILLVEDEPAVRQLFASALQRAGYLVHQARSGEEAVSLFESCPAIDLLLTDIRMPEMSGLELVRQLSARAPALKVICISGYPGAGTDPPIPHHYLAKPFSRADLLAKVREVLGA
jgi:two-component system cell cycle sensor histidine kinase/response regulator CckA